MSDQSYSGLTVGANYDEYADRYVIGLECDGGFVPFAQVSRAKFEKWLPLTQPQPQADQPSDAPAPVATPAQ